MRRFFFASTCVAPQLSYEMFQVYMVAGPTESRWSPSGFLRMPGNVITGDYTNVKALQAGTFDDIVAASECRRSDE